MALPPVLSTEARQAALAKAAEARTARAELKARLKMGSVTLKEVIAADQHTANTNLPAFAPGR